MCYPSARIELLPIHPLAQPLSDYLEGRRNAAER
jgi:hypothetical protein